MVVGRPNGLRNLVRSLAFQAEFGSQVVIGQHGFYRIRVETDGCTGFGDLKLMNIRSWAGANVGAPVNPRMTMHTKPLSP